MKTLFGYVLLILVAVIVLTVAAPVAERFVGSVLLNVARLLGGAS